MSATTDTPIMYGQSMLSDIAVGGILKRSDGVPSNPAIAAMAAERGAQGQQLLRNSIKAVTDELTEKNNTHTAIKISPHGPLQARTKQQTLLHNELTKEKRHLLELLKIYQVALRDSPAPIAVLQGLLGHTEQQAKQHMDFMKQFDTTNMLVESSTKEHAQDHALARHHEQMKSESTRMLLDNFRKWTTEKQILFDNSTFKLLDTWGITQLDELLLLPVESLSELEGKITPLPYI